MSAWIRWILAISVLYFGGVSYWYVKHHKAVGHTRAPTAAKTMQSTPPIAFDFRAPAAKTTPAFSQFQQQLILAGKPEDALLITGLYFTDEDNGGVPNLGELRAQAAAGQFQTMLPLERIKTASRREARMAPSQSQIFEAIDFSWVALNAPVPYFAEPEPLVFDVDSAAPVTGTDFSAFRSAFGQGGKGQQFEITGVWYQSEVLGAGSRDLGLERAKAAQNLFADVIAPDRTQLRSLLLSDAQPASPFAAARFRWIDALPLAASSTQTLTIYFGSNRSTRTLTDGQSAQLQAFVNSAGGKRVLITGHTDTSGSAGKNRALAAARAEFLTAALKQAGIQAELSQASIASEAPKGDNDTVVGREANRRAEAAIQ